MHLLRLPEVQARTGLGRSSIYQRQRDGLFPPSISIGTRMAAWPDHEIDAINKAHIAGQTDDEIRALVARLVIARKGAA